MQASRADSVSRAWLLKRPSQKWPFAAVFPIRLPSQGFVEQPHKPADGMQALPPLPYQLLHHSEFRAQSGIPLIPASCQQRPLEQRRPTLGHLRSLQLAAVSGSTLSTR